MRAFVSGIISVALSLAAITGCEEKPVQLRLTVDARTNLGEPVIGAAVVLDGKQIGATDRQGAFSTEVSVPTGSNHRVEVRKESDEYYFAPFFDAFVIGKESPQQQPVAATLYFVPKPKPDGQVAAAAPAAPAVQDPGTPPAVSVPAPAPAGAEVPGGGDVVVSAMPAMPSKEAIAPSQVPAAPPVAAETASVTEPAPVAEPAAATEPVSAEAAASAAPETATQGPAAVAAMATVEAPLASVAEGAASALPPAIEDEPEVGPPTPVVYTVHVFGEATAPVALSEAEVRVAHSGANALETGCRTNARGRCVIRFAGPPPGPVTFVASMPGYRTEMRTVTVRDQGSQRFTLPKGDMLDIYAVTTRFGREQGLEGVQVSIGGKVVGATDRLGRYSHLFTGKREDLLTVTLKPKGMLPETWETDFVASGTMRLIKQFTPAEPPSVNLAVFPPRMAGSTAGVDLKTLVASLEQNVRGSVRRLIHSATTFVEVPPERLQAAVKASGRSAGDWLRRGWVDEATGAGIDAGLVVTAIPGGDPAIEVTVVDARGRVQMAVREGLDSLEDPAAVERVMTVAAAALSRSFAFEGAVLTREGDKATINLGHGSGRGLKAGDILDVHGTLPAPNGQTRAQAQVATLVVKEMQEHTAAVSVTSVVDRGTVERGDLVVLRTRKSATAAANKAQIKVVEAAGGQAVSHANVYLNERWLGTTDAGGRVWAAVSGSGTLRVVKTGFEAYAQPVTLTPGGRADLALKRESALLRVATVPPGAVVRVDGAESGKTPLTAPLRLSTGFVRLETSGPAGYKPFSQVLELDDGTLDLTGERAITLERDLLGEARAQLAQDRVSEALDQMTRIPKNHSDYLASRHAMGELYLKRLDDPEKAVAAFAEVTAVEAVRDHSDKRFVGTHINEGIARYTLADRLARSEPDKAREALAQAVRVLEGTIPYLRFVPGAQFGEAAHNVDYHLALAKHRLWQLSQQPQDLAEAVKAWRSYLEGSAKVIPVNDSTRPFVENAQVYYRQAVAKYDNRRGTSTQ